MARLKITEVVLSILKFMAFMPIGEGLVIYEVNLVYNESYVIGVTNVTTKLLLDDLKVLELQYYVSKCAIFVAEHLVHHLKLLI